MKKKHYFWASLCHLSTLLGFVIPGFSFFMPLVIWLWKRDSHSVINQNGRNVLNFVLSFWVYTFGLLFILAASVILFWIPGMITLHRFVPHVFDNTLPMLYFFFCLAYGMVYGLFQFILPMYGALKALNGEVYRYPLTLTLLKETNPYLPQKIKSPK